MLCSHCCGAGRLHGIWLLQEARQILPSGCHSRTFSRPCSLLRHHAQWQCHLSHSPMTEYLKQVCICPSSLKRICCRHVKQNFGYALARSSFASSPQVGTGRGSEPQGLFRVPMGNFASTAPSLSRPSDRSSSGQMLHSFLCALVLPTC